MKKLDNEIKSLYKKVGSNVKKLRVKKGFTQLELAIAIGQRSTTIISQAELGSNKHFNIEQLYKISKVLDCSINDFFIDIH